MASTFVWCDQHRLFAEMHHIITNFQSNPLTVIARMRPHCRWVMTSSRSSSPHRTHVSPTVYPGPSTPGVTLPSFSLGRMSWSRAPAASISTDISWAPRKWVFYLYHISVFSLCSILWAGEYHFSWQNALWSPTKMLRSIFLPTSNHLLIGFELINQINVDSAFFVQVSITKRKWFQSNVCHLHFLNCFNIIYRRGPSLFLFKLRGIILHLDL